MWFLPKSIQHWPTLLQVMHFRAKKTLMNVLQPPPSSSIDGRSSTPSSSLNHSPVSAPVPVSGAAQSHLPGQSICAGIGTPVRSPPGPGPQAPKRQQEISVKYAEHIQVRATNISHIGKCKPKACKSNRARHQDFRYAPIRVITGIYLYLTIFTFFYSFLK